MDIAKLKDELVKDPAALNYAAFINAGNDSGLADKLNAMSDAQVTEAVVSKNHFLRSIVPALLALATKTANVQAKWDRILGVVQAVDGSVDLANETTAGVIALAVADGLLTQGEANAIGQRSGSRAEVLFGAGTFIQTYEVSYALRGKK